MDETNGLSVPIGADPSGLRDGFQQAERIVQSGVSRIESSLSRIGNIGQQLAGFGAGLTASLTLPITGLATASIKAYGDIQSLQKGLEAVLGSAEKASSEFEKLKEIAKLPGLGMEEAVRGSINLQSIGISANKSRTILSEFGNAVATVGKGREEFERAIYGVQQLANTDFPLGEDLNIIKDALPQVSNLLKDAFGSSRSDELAKMGVSSKQVLDVILKGLSDLPRVSGGINNAFENLGDSIQQSLSRIGKVLDDRLDISKLIEKLTNGIDKLVTWFENLSPAIQTTVVVLAGLASATGPLLLGLGGILALLPTMVSGFNAIKTAVMDFNEVLLTNPYTAIAVALAAIGTALYAYHSSIETAKDRQERFNDALSRATLQARNEVTELEKLYRASQDQTKSLQERNKAVDQLQKQYPAYFGNLSNEAILAGKAGSAYKSLASDIISASRARAATAELDKRNAKRLEEDLDFEKQIKYINEAFTIEKYKNSALEREYGRRSEILKNRVKEDANLIKEIKSGQEAISKIDTAVPDSFVTPKTLSKVKTETSKQISEIFPTGSIAELRQRADLLQKAIDTSVDNIVKVRKNDKIDKNGNPYLTGEILNLEQAYERLEELKFQIGDIEIEPVKIKSAGFMDSFGNEFKTYVDLMASESARLNGILNRTPEIIDESTIKALEASNRYKEALVQLNESLSNVISSGVANSISDAFSSIGTALANGENVLKSLGQSLLGSFGKILSELGKQLIQYGVGLLAIKLAMKSLNPYVAIAAGIALVALGAGVTASISKQSDNIGGGNISSSAGTGTQPTFSSSNYSQSASGGEYVFRLSGADLVSAFNRNVSAEYRVKAG